MKIALVHDYLREYGGAERVVETLHAMWPEAPLYTSFVDWRALGEHAKRFASWDIRTSWVQHNPVVRKLHSPLRFLAPFVWGSFDLSGYDIVISSSGWFMCRGVTVKKPAVHFCYIHHPPRNLYGYATGRTFQKYAAVRAYAAFINFFMRQYDYVTAQKVDYFIANSQETARRVKKFYRRDAAVIYPPVDSKLVTSGEMQKRTYYLSVGRLVWAKQTDIIIRAANERKLPLKIVGTGPEEALLRSIAGPTVEFMGSVSDTELIALYGGAKATIFCALDEDFGMVPIESMSYGTPVIALNQGGVRETVIEGKTGVFFDSPEVSSLLDSIARFENITTDWEGASKKRAAEFSTEQFRKKILTFVRTHTGKAERKTSGRL